MCGQFTENFVDAFQLGPETGRNIASKLLRKRSSYSCLVLSVRKQRVARRKATPTQIKGKLVRRPVRTVKYQYDPVPAQACNRKPELKHDVRIWKQFWFVNRSRLSTADQRN